MRQRGAARHLSHDVIPIPGTDAPDPPIWLLVRQCGGCCLPAHGELNGARPAQPTGATNAPAPRLLHRVTGGCRHRSLTRSTGDTVRDVMRRCQALVFAAGAAALLAVGCA